MEIHKPEHHRRRLAELDLQVEQLDRALQGASAEVRGCTEFDAPSAPGFLFWTRANRFIAEELDPLGWARTSRDSILRMIHPTRSHAITAISGEGAIGDLDGRVRSKNPKGNAMARLTRDNEQLVLVTSDEILYGVELDQVPTWFLLYRRHLGKVHAELSLPAAMTGKYVDDWLERIPLDIEIGDPGNDIELVDDSPDGDEGPEVSVEFREG